MMCAICRKGIKNKTKQANEQTNNKKKENRKAYITYFALCVSFG